MKAVFLSLLCMLSLSCWAKPCDLSANSQLILAQQLGRTLQGQSELTQWKKWESLLLECREAVDLSKPDTLRDFLFLGYVARETNAAATREYMIGELYPIYKSAPETLLSVLKQAPAFTESSCYYLGRYFGFEDRETITKAAFLKDNAGRFYASLSPEQAQRCLNALAKGR